MAKNAMLGDTGKSPAYYAWQRLKKNRTAFVSLLFIAFCSLISVLGYLISPDSTPNVNDQQIELETLKPGTQVTLLRIKKNQPETHISILEKMLYGAPDNYTQRPITSYKISGDKIMIQPINTTNPADAEIYSLADVLYALKDTLVQAKDGIFTFQTYKGEETAILGELQKRVEKNNIITRTYWLGTDRFGRDMLGRLILGTRISLGVGFISVIISLFVGITLGAMAGFFRGWVDSFIQWLINVVWSIPTFLWVMAIALVLGRGFWQVFIAVGLTMWVEVARLVRGQILSARELEYVQAAKALGFGSSRIIYKHLLPNILGPVLVIAAANFASAILLEAGLSFLGVGVQPPAPSWGMMINDHYGYIVVDAAYLAILPGLAIALLVLAFNLLGNGLRDALDVKMK
jgi:peptide/nickel transport system permease protein